MSNYLDTASNLANGLAALAKNITLWRFIRWLFVLILIAGGVLYFYENYFSSNYHFNKLERKLTIIEKAKKIGINDSSIQNEADKKLLEIIQNLDPPAKTISKFNFLKNIDAKNIWSFIVKFLSAFIMPLIIVLIDWNSKDKEGNSSLIIGAIAVAIFFGIIAVLIPTINSLWINFIITPIATFLILYPLGKITDKK